MRDSRLRALFVLALMLVACQSGERAKTAATKLATVDAGVAPPHVDAAPPAPTIVMEELPAPMPHAEMVTDLPSGRVLASGRRELSDAVIAGAYVYFASASDGTIQRVPLAGGRFEVIARGGAQPSRLAVRAGKMYWIDRGLGTLQRAPLAGGAGDLLLGGLVEPVALDFQGNDVIVATSRQVWRVPSAGGRAKIVANDLHGVTAIAAAAADVFVAADGDQVIWRVPPDGKRVPFVRALDHPVDLRVDGGRLLWVAQGLGAGAGVIGARPLAGGPIERLADALDHPRLLTLAPGGALGWIADGPEGHEPAHWASLFVRGKDGKSDARASTPHRPRALAASPAGWILAGPAEILLLPFAAAPRHRAYELVAAAPGQPRALAADREAVYWVTYQGAVMKARRAGGAPELLAHAPRGLSAMTRDGDAVAWTSYDAGSVGRVAVAGGAAVEVASGRPHPIALAARAGEIYFADDEGVHAVASLGGPVRRLSALGGSPHALAVDDEAVYALAAVPGGDRLVRVPLAGGPLEVLAEGLDGADQLAVAGDWVYVLDEEPEADFPNTRGQLWRVARRGAKGARERLAAGLMSPNGLTVGAGFVWFAYADGRIARVPVEGGSLEIVAGAGRNVGALCVDGGDLLVASGGTLQGNWKDGAILRLRLGK